MGGTVDQLKELLGTRGGTGREKGPSRLRAATRELERPTVVIPLEKISQPVAMIFFNAARRSAPGLFGHIRLPLLELAGLAHLRGPYERAFCGEGSEQAPM